MRLILHVGTHKTGTTSIQAALAGNRRWLAERGYIFPPLCGSLRSHNEFADRIALANPAARATATNLKVLLEHRGR